MNENILQSTMRYNFIQAPITMSNKYNIVQYTMLYNDHCETKYTIHNRYNNQDIKMCYNTQLEYGTTIVDHNVLQYTIEYKIQYCTKGCNTQ